MTARAHGTHVRYVQGPDIDDVPGKGCRCDPCRKANRDYEKARQRRLEPAYVSAHPAREHLRMLSEHGIGLKTVAKATGLSHGGLSKIIHGDRKRGMAPSKRIRRDTLERILAVHPGYNQRGGTRVDARPVWKMVDELVAAGVPHVRIAERCGQSNALQLGREYVTRRNAAAIKAMYDEYRAGQLITIKRHRNGDRIIAPTADRPGRARRRRSQPGVEINPYDLLAEVVEARNNESEWRRQAACRNRPTYLWFPARGDRATLDHAKKICGACTVRAQCLAANLDQPDGIYGGLSPKRRRPILAAETSAA